MLEAWVEESLYFNDLTMRSWLLQPLVPKVIDKDFLGHGLGRKEPEFATGGDAAF